MRKNLFAAALLVSTAAFARAETPEALSQARAAAAGERAGITAFDGGCAGPGCAEARPVPAGVNPARGKSADMVAPAAAERGERLTPPKPDCPPCPPTPWYKKPVVIGVASGAIAFAAALFAAPFLSTALIIGIAGGMVGFMGAQAMKRHGWI